MTKPIHWQEYKDIYTGKIYGFKLTAPGLYEREDGAVCRRNRLDKHYTWVSGEGVKRPPNKYYISPNGFKIRETNKHRRDNEEMDLLCTGTTWGGGTELQRAQQ